MKPEKMTLRELKYILNHQPPERDDWVIVVARDPEGNGFALLDEITPGHFEDEYGDCGEFGDGEGALCLWPSG